MNKVRGFFTSLLSGRGNISSKRFIAFGAFVLCVIAFIGNLFFKLAIDQHLWDSMLYVTMGGLGFTSLERIFKKNSDSITNNENVEP